MSWIKILLYRFLIKIILILIEFIYFFKSAIPTKSNDNNFDSKPRNTNEIINNNHTNLKLMFFTSES